MRNMLALTSSQNWTDESMTLAHLADLDAQDNVNEAELGGNKEDGRGCGLSSFADLDTPDKFNEGNADVREQDFGNLAGGFSKSGVFTRFQGLLILDSKQRLLQQSGTLTNFNGLCPC